MEPVKKDGMEGLYQALLQRAAEARETAYCPYSGFAACAGRSCGSSAGRILRSFSQTEQTKSGIPWRSCCPFPLGRSSWESGKSVEACFPCLWEQAPEKEAVLCAWWISFTKNGRAVN